MIRAVVYLRGCVGCGHTPLQISSATFRILSALFANYSVLKSEHLKSILQLFYKVFHEVSSWLLKITVSTFITFYYEAPWKLAPRKLAPEKLPPELPHRKLPPKKISPYENTHLWKFSPLKIAPLKNAPKKNTPRKLTPRKLLPMKVATIVVRNWKLLPCSGGHGFRGSTDTYLIWYG